MFNLGNLRARLWPLLTTLLLAMACALPGHAREPNQRVYDEPGGYEVGRLRDGDRIEMLQYQTVYRNGKNERWAYISYYDSLSSSKGWIRLDDLRVQDKRAAPQTPSYPSYSNSPPARGPALAQTDIRDMDISCYDNSRGSIGGCNLSVQVDISGGTGDAALVCEAELVWFAVGGGEQVASARVQENVSLYSANTRKRVKMNFNFGSRGATGAMVENQKCSTQAFSYDSYDGYYGNETYR